MVASAKVQRAKDALDSLPPDRQEELADIILAAATDDGEPLLSPEQEAEIERRLANPDLPFVSDAEMATLFRRWGL